MVDQTWKHSLGKWERIGTQQSGGNRALLCFLGNVEGTEEIPVCHHFRQCGTNKKKKNTHSHGRVFGEDENPREERKRRWDNPPWYVIRTIRDYEAQCASLREREREILSCKTKPNLVMGTEQSIEFEGGIKWSKLRSLSRPFTPNPRLNQA